MVKYKSLINPGKTVDTFGGGLKDKFGMPPFSVLDARSGPWQDRKAAWLSLGIKSELGRGENLLKFSDTVLDPNAKKRGGRLLYATGGERTDEVSLKILSKGRKLNALTYGSGGPGTLSKELKSRAVGVDSGFQRTPNMKGKPDNPEMAIPGWYSKLAKGMTKDQIIKEWEASKKKQTRSINTQDWVQKKTAEGDIDGGMAANQSGTSIFDPVICEMFYRWFVPQGGSVLDPFAGGSVRGIVASRLGYQYTGFDLRQEQVDANQTQQNLCTPGEVRWICDDSRNLANHIKPSSVDAVFSCPPYVDLERYSDDPRDLSTLGYEEFMQSYEEIIAACAKALKPDRFASFVVGEVRGGDGSCLGFVPGTVTAFAKAGLRLYNDAILVTSVGSLAIRADRQFTISRKLGRTHQYFLIFVKGDARRAVAEINDRRSV